MVTGMLCSAAGMVLLTRGDDMWLFYVFVLMFAVGESIGPVNWSILGENFGRRRFATLRGYLTAMSVFGAAMPEIIGRLYDVDGTYEASLIILSGLYLAAAGLYAALWLVGRRAPVALAGPA
jgi:hypothetical protein